MRLDELAPTTETARSNTPSQEAETAADRVLRTGVSNFRYWLANPVRFHAELVEMADDMATMADEDRYLSEAAQQELDLAVEAGNRTMEHAVSGDNERMAEMLTETMDDVRPSEAGFVSYNDDPWTSFRTMEAKHAADLAAEAYPYTTTAGTGWWGELSAQGFGPTALLPLGTARKDWAEFDGRHGETIQEADPVLVRLEAGFRPDDSSAYRTQFRGQYRDFIQAAGMSVIVDDEYYDVPPTLEAPLWDTEGVLDAEVWEAILADEGLAPLA